MIAIMNIMKSMDFKEIIDFQWKSMVFGDPESFTRCEISSPKLQNIENRQKIQFLERAGDSVHKSQNFDISTFWDRNLDSETEISILSDPERFWAILSDSEHPSLFLKLPMQ